MSDSVQPPGQPTRLPCPWDSPGKNTGVGYHFLLPCMKVKSESEVAQSCPTLSDPMDCSLPGSSIHGIFQARVLEWGAIAFSDHLLTGGHQMKECLHPPASTRNRPHQATAQLSHYCLTRHRFQKTWHLAPRVYTSHLKGNLKYPFIHCVFSFVNWNSNRNCPAYLKGLFVRMKKTTCRSLCVFHPL